MPSSTQVHTTRHPGDALSAMISARRTPVCVGLDPVLDRLPVDVRGNREITTEADAAACLATFCHVVINAVQEHVPAVKFQSACFERYHAAGIAALHEGMARARERGLIVILDNKRGDIGISAEHYAASCQGLADWVTANSYLGVDGLKPMLDAGLGVFALVRTSNPSAAVIQNQQLADGRTVAEMIAEQIHELAMSYTSTSGTSALGAVVGATDHNSAAQLRERLTGQMLLVPGYGAQGGGIGEVLPCFETDGRNAIVTASRSIIYAYEQSDHAGDWKSAIQDAVRLFADDVGRATGWR